MLKSEPRANSV